MGGGARMFWGCQRGDHYFFSVLKGGPKFFAGQRRGTKIFSPKFCCPFHCLCEGDNLSLGGPEFYHKGKGGTRIFLCIQRGDQKKLATGHHKQTAPPPVKNDSSLIGFSDQFHNIARHCLAMIGIRHPVVL